MHSRTWKPLMYVCCFALLGVDESGAFVAVAGTKSSRASPHHNAPHNSLLTDRERGQSMDRPVVLEGNSVAGINTGVLMVLLFILGTVSLGYWMDKSAPTPCTGKDGSPMWLNGLLISSYVILIPGIISTLFSFNVFISVLGFNVGVTSNHGVSGPITESTFSVIALLFEKSWRGAFFVVLYAIIVPIGKLVMLGLGECWRHSADPSRVAMSRKCILFVQFISKWACPDMFAYIMLIYLIRDLNSSSMITAAGRLDFGFTCFCVFCVCSTLSSLAIKIPVVEEVGEAKAPAVLRMLGKNGVVCVAVALAALFTALFLVGLAVPSMALRVNADALTGGVGKGALDSMLPKVDVSLWQCMMASLRWSTMSGDLNGVLVFVMVGIFVMLLTVLDMIMLLVAAFRLLHEDQAEPTGDLYQMRSSPIKVSMVLKKLSMLDVFLMGLWVTTFCASMYANEGVVLTLREGAFVLLLAELAHYSMFYLVTTVAEHVNGGIARTQKG